MNKSNKRLKIEEEIFSKSIKDIEKMFNLSHLENQELNNDHKKRRLSMNYTYSKFMNSDDPAQPLKTQSKNMQFNKLKNKRSADYFKLLSHGELEVDDREVVTVPILPSSRDHPTKDSSPQFHLKQTLLDSYIDEDMDYYSLGLNMKSYLPRLNLESDLKLIDQMFSISLFTKTN
ncbi:hypothetical protein JCM33374_g575 [Metschnikowia sp. JCM 33374]|nr:hypothetical protein JCM33374_g575 [Metschnikowia sp. JCM 33374]